MLSAFMKSHCAIHPRQLLKSLSRCCATSLETIEVEDRGGVRLITMNRPEKLNALTTRGSAEILATLREVDNDSKLKVSILTGQEKVFCAGADLKEMSSWTHAEVVADQKFYEWTHFNDLAKPIIAAVNGTALGGGCELAMICDILIASENANFSQPETSLALIPGMGGTQRFTRAIGKSKAMELILTGDLGGLTAQEALSYGLVSRVVPQEKLLDEAMGIAEKIARLSSPVIIKAKKCINQGYEQGLTDALRYEVRQFWSCFELEDSKEGMRSFFNKTKPNYKDK